MSIPDSQHRTHETNLFQFAKILLFETKGKTSIKNGLLPLYCAMFNSRHMSAKKKIMHITKFADPGCLSQIPDPDFIHPGSRIPNPTTAPKEEGEIFFVLHFFVATNILTLYGKLFYF
jgi:hypothetical protein